MKKEVSLFLDSGAHSFYMKSKLKNESFSDKEFSDYFVSYMDFIKKNINYVDVYVNLDVINDPEKSYENYLIMKRNGLGDAIPVVHPGEDPKWMRKYLALNCGYVGVGGLGQFYTKDKYIVWAERIWNDCLLDSKGYPVVKVHGFAMTSLELMLRFPFFSVDSVGGNSLLLIKEAGQIRVDTIENLYYSAMGSKRKLPSGHDCKDLVDVETFVPSGGKNKGKWIRVESVVRHDVMKKRYRVKTRRGRVVDLTVDHGIFIFKDRKVSLTTPLELKYKSDDRKKNSFVVGVDFKDVFSDLRELVVYVDRQFYVRCNELGKSSTKRLLPFRVTFDRLFLEFLGLWVADGSYSSSGSNAGVCLSVGNDVECSEVVKSVAERYSSTVGVSPNGIDLTIHSTLLSRVVQCLGFGRGSRNKEIPWWVFELSEENLGYFLRGYFSGDGTVGSDGPVECSTVSKKLL